MDGSIVRLPNQAELRLAFIPRDVTNDRGQVGIHYAEARMSIVYDLLNRVGLDGRLEPSRVGESALAFEQLSCAAHPTHVNRAVSFHALKDQLRPLLYSDLPVEGVVAKLELWFTGAPVSVRESRKVPRGKFSWPRSYTIFNAGSEKSCIDA